MHSDAPLSVLVVDDDPLLLAATARYLRKWGLRTICTDSPFGVSLLVRKEAPDVIVLDCHMPGLDGVHMVRVLRSSPRTASTPVVFHSGDAEEPLSELARVHGVRYSCKASGPVRLLEVIRGALRNRGDAVARGA